MEEVSCNGWRWLPPKFVEKADLGGRLALLGSDEKFVCVFTHSSMEWNVPGKCEPHGELFFFLIQKELATVPGSETFSSFFNSERGYPSLPC